MQNQRKQNWIKKHGKKNYYQFLEIIDRENGVYRLMIIFKVTKRTVYYWRRILR